MSPALTLDITAQQSPILVGVFSSHKEISQSSYVLTHLRTARTLGALGNETTLSVGSLPLFSKRVFCVNR